MVWLFSCISCFGQNQQDSLQMEGWLQSSRTIYSSNPDSAIIYNQLCIELARKVGAMSFVVKAEYLNGVAYKQKSDYDLSEAAFQRCMDIANENSDSLLLAQAYYGMGMLKRHQGDYSNSLKLMNTALELNKQYSRDSVNIARTHNGIGNIFYKVGKYKEAIEQYKKALAIHQQLPGREQFVASTSVNIGGLYVVAENLDSAFFYLEKGMDWYQKINNPLGVGAASLNLSEAHLNNGNLAQSEFYALKGLDNFTKSGNKARIGMALNALSQLRKKQGNIKGAIDYAEQSLIMAQEVGRPDNIRDQYLSISELYKEDDDYQAALDYYQKYTAIKDSLFNEVSDLQLLEEKEKFESFVKDQEIETLKSQQKRSQRERNRLLAGLIILGLVILVIYYFLRARQVALKKLKTEQDKTQALLSEKNQLVSQLESAQTQLIQNEKMASLGQLSAGIAHEINNPINFITGNITALKLDFEEVKQLLVKLEELKKSDPQPADIQELIKLSDRLDSAYLSAEISQLINGITRGAIRTQNIVTSLRTFSRNTTEEYRPADINEGIESTLIILKGSIAPDIEIITDYGDFPPIPCQISRLNQVFLNIINNAVQAIGKKGHIYIKTVLLDQEVKIAIQDDGPGMDTETQRRIFEPFFTTKDVGKGTGMGLSISYGIVEQHQGRLEVESTPDQGACFNIYLPLQQRSAI